MKSRKRLAITLSALIFIFIVIILMLNGVVMVVGNGDGDSDDDDAKAIERYYQENPEHRPDPVTSRGEFFAVVEHRDDLHDVITYTVKVRVHPALEDWPDTAIASAALEASVVTDIQLRNLSVPSVHSSRDRPHPEVERELERYAASIDFLWSVIKASEYLILTNPERMGGLIKCDAFINFGGVRLSLTEMLIEAGHALPTPVREWGKRLVN